jgi:hypothetical protein
MTSGLGYRVIGAVAGVAVLGAAIVLVGTEAGRALFDREASETMAETLESYCVSCHNGIDLTANLALDGNELTDIGAHAEVWEKVLHRLDGGSMPPLGEPRPGSDAYETIVGHLEAELDAAAAAAPNAGRLPLLRRLTRTEYKNAIRDLLALDNLPVEMDFELLLPADNASSGFDNIADLLFVSPVTMERYLGAAQKIARLAVGDPRMPTMVNIHRLPLELPQDEPVAGLPFGTRGGLVTETYFPLDADYVFVIEPGRAREIHEVELTIDGERVALGEVGRGSGGPGGDSRLEFRVPVSAGPHIVGATFVRRTHALDESTVRVQRRSRGTLPAIELVTISGPFAPTGSGTTPSRDRIFLCTPEVAADEAPCARRILATLAGRAYRRPVTDADIEPLMAFYEDGRNEGGFDAGVQRALERLLVSPLFLYRIERVPESAEAGQPFPVSPVELASRLSFFLWSSLPDDRLLELATSGALADDDVLVAEAERMLKDPRAASLVNNFAAQWLFLRDVEAKDPDVFIFRDYDEGLREAFMHETELFVGSVLREERSVLDLIRADYTFVNERLAEHYGIPHIKGSRFRRVTFPEGNPRGGLLGQGSILTLTSYPTRTSPVLRGKYILDNLLASPPPPPPPDVPALEAAMNDEQATMTLRESMARHRENPECASCHALMDPIGFAFENFDAIGRWRETEGGLPIDVASTLVDGTVVDGVEGLRALLLSDSERFVSAVTEKLLMYALGRNVQYYDRPTIRDIVRAAADDDHTFSALIRGIVTSVPFRMRMTSDAQPTGGEG